MQRKWRHDFDRSLTSTRTPYTLLKVVCSGVILRDLSTCGEDKLTMRGCVENMCSFWESTCLNDIGPEAFQVDPDGREVKSDWHFYPVLIYWMSYVLVSHLRSEVVSGCLPYGVRIVTISRLVIHQDHEVKAIEGCAIDCRMYKYGLRAHAIRS